MHEETRAEILKKRENAKDKDKSIENEKSNLEGEQLFIQKNIQKIKNLIESHRNIQKKKNIQDIEVKEEEQEMQVEKPKSWKNEKIIAKAKKSSRTKK